jgi:hypothetical protein
MNTNPSEEQVRMVRGSLKGTTPIEKLWKRFNDEISSRTNALDILRLYENHGHEFHTVHLVTALHRVARSPNGCESVHDDRFVALSNQVVEALGHLGDG